MVIIFVDSAVGAITLSRYIADLPPAIAAMDASGAAGTRVPTTEDPICVRHAQITNNQITQRLRPHLMCQRSRSHLRERGGQPLGL